MPAFIFVEVNDVPTELAGVVDGTDYAGQNSPRDIGSQVNQPPILYRKQAAGDPDPDPNTINRAVVPAFGTGQFSPESGYKIFVWTLGGVTTLVLADR